MSDIEQTATDLDDLVRAGFRNAAIASPHYRYGNELRSKAPMYRASSLAARVTCLRCRNLKDEATADKEVH